MSKTVHFADDSTGNAVEALSAEEAQPLQNQQTSFPQPSTVRSQYALSKQEIARGIANRFVHSRTYVILYLTMAALSITTIALSVAEGCPGLAFYILEIVINTTMISEVSIRFVAFGRQFWKSPFNVLDLVLTLFCVTTLLVLTFSSCGATSKEEEILDTLLLVARNVLQFSRLAAVMRQSGQSIFSRPKPIDLSSVRRRDLDLDIDFDRELDVEESAGLGRDDGGILFDDGDLEEADDMSQLNTPSKKTDARNDEDDRDAEDVWASLG